LLGKRTIAVGIGAVVLSIGAMTPEVVSAAPAAHSCAAQAAATGARTPADVLHPNIHDKVGDGSNANPNGKSPNGGGEIHGIANVPGKGGDQPGGAGGFADNLGTVHGGIGECNPNA
jgi:hypothetical protein